MRCLRVIGDVSRAGALQNIIGHWQGLNAAPGASCLKLLTWNRYNASAMLLLIPVYGCV